MAVLRQASGLVMDVVVLMTVLAWIRLVMVWTLGERHWLLFGLGMIA